MTTVSFSVGSLLTYRAKALELPGCANRVEVKLERGDNVFTSPRFALGTIFNLGGLPLTGIVSFRYNYDPDNEMITVCGNDYKSADGMKLITSPEGMDDHVCVQHASGAGFADDETATQTLWDYRSQLTPGAAEIFQQMVQDANNELISALERVPNLIVRIRMPLPQLSPQRYFELCQVERNGKVMGSFDPTQKYEFGDLVRLPESTFAGVVKWPKTQNFANVKGSKDDPRPGYDSWIELWEAETGVTATACTSLNYGAGEEWECSGRLVGGHIIKGVTASEEPVGSNDVYILPICERHNNWRNDKYYMKCITYQQAVWLNNYNERGLFAGMNGNATGLSGGIAVSDNRVAAY